MCHSLYLAYLCCISCEHESVFNAKHVIQKAYIIIQSITAPKYSLVKSCIFYEWPHLPLLKHKYYQQMSQHIGKTNQDH